MPEGQGFEIKDQAGTAISARVILQEEKARQNAILDTNDVRRNPVHRLKSENRPCTKSFSTKHWDVIEEETTQEQSKSGHLMFGDKSSS